MKLSDTTWLSLFEALVLMTVPIQSSALCFEWGEREVRSYEVSAATTVTVGGSSYVAPTGSLILREPSFCEYQSDDICSGFWARGELHWTIPPASMESNGSALSSDVSVFLQKDMHCYIRSIPEPTGLFATLGSWTEPVVEGEVLMHRLESEPSAQSLVDLDWTGPPSALPRGIDLTVPVREVVRRCPESTPDSHACPVDSDVEIGSLRLVTQATPEPSSAAAALIAFASLAIVRLLASTEPAVLAGARSRSSR